MPDLQVTGLCFQGRGPYTFHIQGGQCLGLAGVSGAGKSLLLRAVVDLDPRTGTMSLGGVDADSLPAPSWRRMVGLLPAESGWWLDSVGAHFQNFASVDGKMLAELGFDYSAGNWQVSRLSSGERQRMAIARLLDNRPQCLLLDEPTANLDPQTAEKVEQVLCDYGRVHQAPLLWVSHDAEQLQRISGQIMHMQEGGNIDTGTEPQ